MSSIHLEVNTVETGKSAEVELSGILDLGTVNKLRLALDELLSRGCKVIVMDMSSVQFVDSSGIGFIARMQRKLKDQDCSLAMRNLSPQLESALRLPGMGTYFNIETTAEQA